MSINCGSVGDAVVASHGLSYYSILRITSSLTMAGVASYCTATMTDAPGSRFQRPSGACHGGTDVGPVVALCLIVPWTNRWLAQVTFPSLLKTILMTTLLPPVFVRKTRLVPQTVILPAKKT